MKQVEFNNDRRLRDIVIGNMPELADNYFAILLNRREAAYISAEKQAKIISAFESILPRIPLERPDESPVTSKDVLRLIGEGKVTISEAERLMRIVQMEFEMTEVRELMARLEELESKSGEVAL